MKLVKLYFGMNIGRNGKVSETEWKRYLEAIDELWQGYTVTEGYGMWQGQQEQCKIVEKVGDEGSNVVNEARTLGTLYKDLYYQDAVMMTVQTVDVEFI